MHAWQHARSSFVLTTQMHRAERSHICEFTLLDRYRFGSSCRPWLFPLVCSFLFRMDFMVAFRVRFICYISRGVSQLFRGVWQQMPCSRFHVLQFRTDSFSKFTTTECRCEEFAIQFCIQGCRFPILCWFWNEIAGPQFRVSRVCRNCFNIARSLLSCIRACFAVDGILADLLTCFSESWYECWCEGTFEIHNNFTRFPVSVKRWRFLPQSWMWVHPHSVDEQCAKIVFHF